MLKICTCLHVLLFVQTLLFCTDLILVYTLFVHVINFTAWMLGMIVTYDVAEGMSVMLQVGTLGVYGVLLQNAVTYMVDEIENIRALPPCVAAAAAA